MPIGLWPSLSGALALVAIGGGDAPPRGASCRRRESTRCAGQDLTVAFLG
jgi:hypothetical protein